MSYCTQADVTARLSSAGIAYQTDDTLAESAAWPVTDSSKIDTAIAYADTRIDFYVESLFRPTSQLHGNDYLNQAAVAYAVYWICTRRGEAAPASILDEADRYDTELSKIQSGGARIPGATYPGDSNEPRTRLFGVPRVANPRP